MSTALVTLETHPRQGQSRSVTVPILIPDLDEVLALAARLHAEGNPYSGREWGWQVTYEPEIRESAAEVQIPDGKGGFTKQTMPLWSPASFTIGENEVWFFSLLWENGADQKPVEFLDDGSLLGTD
ncbi:MAG: hypothetical protein IT331_02580 [Anaerolineae bacterium]|nr:hypothetical protein [Anaerolineae bacterium]